MMIWRGKYSGPILGYSWTPPHAVCMYRLVHRTRTSVMRRRIFRGMCRGGAIPRRYIFSTMKFRTMSILYDRGGAVVMHLYRTACINGNFRQNRPHFSTGVYAHTPHKKRHLCTETPTKMVFFLAQTIYQRFFALFRPILEPTRPKLFSGTISYRTTWLVGPIGPFLLVEILLVGSVIQCTIISNP
jgi:hypothetical protein